MNLQEQIDALETIRRYWLDLSPSTWNESRWQEVRRSLTSVAVALEYCRDKAEDYVANLERETTLLKDKLIARDAEIARLEACLQEGDYYPCEECQGVWSLDDLATVNGDKYCPRCVEAAKAEDAYEAKADAAIDAEYRGCRR